PERAERSARRHDVGRRAADVRDRPRADVETEAAAAGRAFRRARAARRAAGVRSRAQNPGRRIYSADRRAERATAARARRSRISARGRTHQARRHGSRAQGQSIRAPGVSRTVGAHGAMDIYLVEALLNGLLLGGVLALLALGLNLIFGVIDVVWIAYAELVMCGMYV